MANLLELQDELTRLAPLFDDVDKLYAEQLDSVTHWNSSAGQTQGDPEFNLEDCEPLCFTIHNSVRNLQVLKFCMALPLAVPQSVPMNPNNPPLVTQNLTWKIVSCRVSPSIIVHITYKF